MSRARLPPLALSVCSALCGSAQAASVQHAEPLRAYGVEARGTAEKPTAGAPTVVTFNAFSRDFSLELEPNGRLAAVVQHVDTATAYRGKIAGVRNSWVRLVLTPQGPSGLVFDGAVLYGIEAGEDASRASMFRLADVYFEPGELGCEISEATIDGEQALAAMAEEFTTLAALGATQNLDLGAVADFEFSQAFGANAEAAVLTRFNNVDGIFSEQLGIQITVKEVDIFTAADDPFTASTGGVLLDEVARYRGATSRQDALGLTHLLTGRDLDGGTAGIAFFGAVCATRNRFDARSFGAGLSEARRGAVIDSLVAAHEIGHSFGAPHDGDASGNCASTPTTFLMAPNINGSNRFSACSIQEMQAEIASATCLAPVGPPDMAVELAQPPQAFAGAQFTHSATIRNHGRDEATQVAFTATAAPGLAILTAEAGGAACTVSPSSASCAFGAVGGGGARSVTLSMQAGAPGSFSLTGAVTASNEGDPSDNSRTVTITAIPSVDLGWSGAGSAVALDAQTTINATLANATDFAATSMTVTATFSAGLRPDEATLAGAACTVSGQSVACPARTLAARGSVDLTLRMTGIAAGAGRVTMVATASETDRNPADNQSLFTVTVNAPASANDGGGGALSWWAFAALFAALSLHRAGVPNGAGVPCRRRSG